MFYMAARAATRQNTILEPFYAPPCHRGKPGKVALTVVMRKLTVLLKIPTLIFLP